MVRPFQTRQIRLRPRTTYFKPRGIPMNQLSEVVLTLDEVEALRLKNIEDLDQAQCAKKMKISSSTLQRILTSAYKKVTEALIKGKAIRFEGGAVEYKTPVRSYRNRNRGR